MSGPGRKVFQKLARAQRSLLAMNSRMQKEIWDWLVNAVGHIVQAAILRRYNPGLVTSIVMFLPLAGWGGVVVSKGARADWVMQGTGLLVAVVVHVLIIIHVKRQLRLAGQ